jgi:hypothetical protein
MKRLAQYTNGNVNVIIYDDGTKVREYEGTPAPVHPESIDLKITDWCDAGCSFCHESSTTRGQHASFDTIMDIVGDLPPGVEIAIGGGDPLAHPDIVRIVQAFTRQGLIANITINSIHVFQHFEQVKSLRKCGLIYGVGVSYQSASRDASALLAVRLIADQNTVVHVIAGVHTPAEVMRLMRLHNKILVLGYKQYGRGIACYSGKVEQSLAAWRYWIGPIMRSNATVCFDNLALKQLDIKNQIPEELWTRCYMGGDGTFTMYADAVRDQFAVSSTSTRMPRLGMSMQQMFQSVRAGRLQHEI